MPTAPRLLVLATDPWGVGGIQRITRSVLATLSDAYGPDRAGLLAIWEGDGLLPPCVILHRGHPARAGSTGRVPLGARISYATAAVRAARRWRADPLLVVACHPHLAPIAWVAARAAKSPFVVWCYGIEVWGSLRRSVRAALTRADRLLAISEFTADRLDEAVPGARTRTTVVSPGATVVDIPDDPVARDSMLVLTVSRLDPEHAYKGVDTLLLAWPRVLMEVPNAHLTVVGDGGARAHLEGLARRLDVGKSVCFLGRVSDDELRSLYARTGLFALPGRARLGARPEGEGFGVVFLEAGAAGLPVVAGDAGGAREAVVDGETGLLVDPEDPDDVAEAIVWVLTDPAVARRLGTAGRRHANGPGSEAAFRARVLEVVDELVTSRSPGDPVQV
ncbi:MAG: glycosyltransferase family 4 protein [Acidimicrobiia bacterium]